MTIRSGVYSILCTANGKRYIGSSKGVKGRWTNHKSELRCGYHANEGLQHAWNLYGETAFVCDVLEYCPLQKLREREQFWLDQLKPFGALGFNIRPTADNSIQATVTKERIREASILDWKSRSHTLAVSIDVISVLP